MFSDESRFLLSGTDGRVRVWRRRGERILPPNLLQTVAYGRGSLMVWGGISLNNKTDLIFIRGNLTAERYVEVVQNHILPFAHKIGPDFVLMQDRARAHTSRVTTRFLEDSGIQVMDYPPRRIGRCIVGRMEDHSSRNHPQAYQKHVTAVSSCHPCQGW